MIYDFLGLMKESFRKGSLFLLLIIVTTSDSKY